MREHESWKVGDQLVMWSRWGAPSVATITRATKLSVDIGRGMERRKTLAWRNGWVLIDGEQRVRIAKSNAQRSLEYAEHKRSRSTTRETVAELRDACDAWLALHPEGEDGSDG
jgi:hypothetical protein